MTDENEDLTYFWQEEKSQEPYVWHESILFKGIAEKFAEEINKRFNDLSYDKTTKTLSVGRSE